jgi:hypothetical protein
MNSEPSKVVNGSMSEKPALTLKRFDTAVDFEDAAVDFEDAAVDSDHVKVSSTLQFDYKIFKKDLNDYSNQLDVDAQR